ncbi:MAG: RNA-binding protein [Hyphomicrobiales bacterium]|nr:RNA-binding protein [Hyphomicrobiales bacterium]
MSTADDVAPAADEPVEFEERPPKKSDVSRTCIVSRETMPIAELLRFVEGPDGSVVPDLKRNLPGRGVWVEARRAVVEKAVAKNVFARALRRRVSVDPGLCDLIDRLMNDQALGTLGLARKAGEVVVGFAKVEAAVARERLAGLVHAAEAGADGVAKMTAALKRRFGGEADLPVVRIFSGPQLDLALGRSNVIHAALLSGRAAEIFLERAAALGRYRGVSAEMPTNDDHAEKSGDLPQE